MSNLILLIVCLLAGVALRRMRALPENAPLVLNKLLVSFFLPVLTFLHVVDMQIDSRLWLPIAAPWLVFMGGCVFFGSLARRMNFDRGTLGALLLTGGISSISFVGFPIFEWLYGRKGLEMAILMSQAGTFVVCVTAGVAIASWLAAEEPSVKRMLHDMLRFPPFMAFLLALLARWAGYEHAPLTRDVLSSLSRPFSVIALLSVGLQVSFSLPKSGRTALLTGLGYKLLLAPALVYLVFVVILGQKGWAADLCVLGSAIGPMNTAAVLASQYKLNPQLAAQLVGLGIPLSFIGLYILYNLL
ncbi:AEC family transporter [uncultured Fibrella sp.]|uniref:AEC family transporter n=1 Tax=uncultured Fibrella sp. TaxID=1284596 RepID=UPI0035CA60ED